MAQADIAEMAKKVKEWGLLKDRGDGDKDWLTVDAPDGSILQLRLGDTYTRVVWNDANRPPSKRFAYWHLRSTEYPLSPKSDFICTTVEPEYLTALDVLERLGTQGLM